MRAARSGRQPAMCARFGRPSTRIRRGGAHPGLATAAPRAPASSCCMNACTIIARNYLPLARVWSGSLRRHHPDAHLSVLIIDDVHHEVDGTAEDFDVLRLEDLDLPAGEQQRMAMIYEVMELATASKPLLLRRLLHDGADVAVYLDPDVDVFAPVDNITALAGDHGMVLTPHVVQPMPRDGRRASEFDILRSGVYNLGFIAVGPGMDGFLDWWSARLRRDCIVEPEQHVFVDQRWMDLAPACWRHHILRDETCNVAYWNLDGRDLRWTGDRYEVNGRPLRWFHFSGFDPRKPWILSRHQGDAPRILLSERPGVARICAEYSDRLLAAGFAQAVRIPYGYATLPNGVRLDRPMRRLYREALLEHDGGGPPPPPDPFAADGAD